MYGLASDLHRDQADLDQALNLNMLLWIADGKFFKIVGEIVEELLSKRIDTVVQQGNER